MSADLHPITLPNGKKLEGKNKKPYLHIFIIFKKYGWVYTDFNKLTKFSHFLLYLVHTHLFINNEFVPGHGPLIETINPATEEVICSVHSADESDVNAAVEAADKCFNDVWRKVAPAEKGRLVNKLADLMERDKEELAALDALDNGKAYTVARDIDITESIGCFRYFAGWADKIHGKFKNE